MYSNQDIPASRKKLGWYEVGDKIFSNKYHALEHCGEGQYPKYNFHDDIFSAVDWEAEPKEDLYEIYKARAVQLRNSYDNLILYYSGGIDSHSILNTFVNNGIKLDGIIVSGSYSIDNRIKTTCNMEQKTVANAYIDLLKNNAKLKCPVYYMDTVDFHKNLKDENWVYSCGTSLTPQNYTYNFYWQDPWIQNFLMKGKTCFIRGIDKPRVVLENNKWYGAFIDVHVLSGTPSGYLAKKQDWDIQEYFYWTPDLPSITVKQSHKLIDWIENNLEPEEALKLCTKEKIFNRAKYNDVADPLIYFKDVKQKIGEEKNYFSLGKPDFTNLWHKDYWFLKAKDVFGVEYKAWSAGLQKIGKKIAKHHWNAPTVQQLQKLNKFASEYDLDVELLQNPEVFFGTVGSWSKFHYIKDAEF